MEDVPPKVNAKVKVQLGNLDVFLHRFTMFPGRLGAARRVKHNDELLYKAREVLSPDQLLNVATGHRRRAQPHFNHQHWEMLHPGVAACECVCKRETRAVRQKQQEFNESGRELLPPPERSDVLKILVHRKLLPTERLLLAAGNTG